MRPFGGLDTAARTADPGAPRAAQRFRQEQLDASVETLPGVGRKLGAGLRALGLHTVRDLLYHRPRRYEPPAPRARIVDLLVGQEATIECEVLRVGQAPHAPPPA